MNAPAPGWLPDPTGRHEHRYWDGSYWTSDVSDGGVTSFDPYDATAQQPQPGGFGAQGTPSGPGFGSSPGYGAQPQPQGFGSGPYGAQPPRSGGPSAGLLVGLGAAILVVIGLIVFVATNKDDDNKDGDTIASGQDDSTDTTAADDSSSDSSTDSGTNSESDQVMIDAMSEGILASSNGALTEEDADCIAQAMFDELGLERLIEIGGQAGGDDPLGGLTSDEFSGVMDAMLGCVDAETLAEIGLDQGGG